MYLQKKGGISFFRLLWGWENMEKHPVPTEALGFTKEQADWWNYTEKSDPEKFNFSGLNVIPCQSGIVFSEPRRFAGWPANNGIWSWGDEILVNFNVGYHNANITGGHSIRTDMPDSIMLARSLDGGKTWKTERQFQFEGIPTTSPSFNFTNPGFAMKVRNDNYFVSLNRGKTWQGPFQIKVNNNRQEISPLTSRTDYLVTGPKDCLVFFSAETGLVEADYQDRSFCAITNDGGKSFEFLGWMTGNTNTRSVMSSTVKVGENHLVSVMRRKHEQSFGEKPSVVTNWIEASESKDNGLTWTNLGKVADTDKGERNGNPPAVVKLDDGRLCVAYGYREYPYGIRLKTSSDNGKTWSREYVVRYDGATWDLGYPRMVVNSKGEIVLIYYYTTKERFEQYNAVSIIESAVLKS